MDSSRQPAQFAENAGVAALSAAQSVAGKAVTDLAIPVRRIVTFHMNGLGDLLFTLPALAALRHSFPGARITAVVPRAFIPLLQNSPFIDAVWPRPDDSIRALARQFFKLRAQQFDMAIGFSGTLKTTLQMWATGASTRAGYAHAKMAKLLTHQVVMEGPPRIETHLELVEKLGARPTQPDYHRLLEISPQAFQKADEQLSRANIRGDFVIIAAAASGKRTIKEWLPEYWKETIAALAPKLPVVLVGTAASDEITAQLPAGLPVVDLGGKTNLAVLAALCARARLFVGIDSGVLHLAACVGTPVVGIYGPTDWRLTGPRGVPFRIARHPIECSPCMLAKCKWTGDKERACLTRLYPQHVLEAVDAVLLESAPQQ